MLARLSNSATTTLIARQMRDNSPPEATLDNPFTLVSFMETLAPGHDGFAELGIALVETLKTHTEVDLVFHRTRVHGLR